MSAQRHHPLPAVAWASRYDSALSVITTCARCRRRSTLAAASVFGISSSKPEGWMFEVSASERFSYAASTTRKSASAASAGPDTG
jgi:hypothetical protein